MTKESLRLALEALETPWNAPYVNGCDLALGKKVKAITAIKEALANEALEKMAENARELGLDYEPEQEPVAWMYEVNNAHTCLDLFEPPDDAYDEGTLHPLYTTPPQRTWVSPTDKEIEAIWEVAMFANYGVGAELSNQPFVHYARAIEAKLKDKNS